MNETEMLEMREVGRRVGNVDLSHIGTSDMRKNLIHFAVMISTTFLSSRTGIPGRCAGKFTTCIQSIGLILIHLVTMATSDTGCSHQLVMYSM